MDQLTRGELATVRLAQFYEALQSGDTEAVAEAVRGPLPEHFLEKDVTIRDLIESPHAADMIGAIYHELDWYPEERDEWIGQIFEAALNEEDENALLGFLLDGWPDLLYYVRPRSLKLNMETEVGWVLLTRRSRPEIGQILPVFLAQYLATTAQSLEQYLREILPSSLGRYVLQRV